MGHVVIHYRTIPMNCFQRVEGVTWFRIGDVVD